jgi:hypothetical protein
MNPVSGNLAFDPAVVLISEWFTLKPLIKATQKLRPPQ